MAIDYQGLVTQGLASQIAAKIRDAILEGRLRVDERLPTEDELAARFSVSRPTIREALKRLAAQNLIRSRRGASGGNFVTQPSRAEARLAVANAASLLVSLGEFAVRDVIEARRDLELACCRRAARRRTRADLARLDAEVDRQRRADLSDEEFCASDVSFHRALVEAAHNPAMEFVAAGVLESLQPAVNLVIFRHRDRDTVAEQHGRIARALEARDADAACAALATYLRDLQRQSVAARSARARRRTASGRG
ncbi:MAG: FadR family transcriptional regulator [Proteobacteria bacterium]|nr:FadR family transcriptional regulator [Pseudomonadota bacterium]